ncbi:MAG TPA: hypothetical protein VMH28_24695 [Candidatus Acidoferrales bacterium]|nr:hypothetical protein [Candidatus Acidoferrales bacterium]
MRFRHIKPRDGAVGLLVVLMMVWLLLAGLPPSRWFLAMAVPVGLAAAIALHLAARER